MTTRRPAPHPLVVRYASQRGKNLCRRVLVDFHAWLDTQHSDVSRLTREGLDAFFVLLEHAAPSPRARQRRRRQVQRYLGWLCQEGLLGFQVGLPPILIRYAKEARRHVRRPALLDFHAWLDVHRCEIGQLTQEELAAFRALERQRQPPGERRRRRLELQSYLIWLREAGLLNVEVSPPPMPPLVVRYIQQTGAAQERTVLADLHAWLHTQSVEITDVTSETLTRFLAANRQDASPRHRQAARRALLHYFRWLRSEGLRFALDLDHVRVGRLPPRAEEFITERENTHKVSSCVSARSCLRHLARWLNAEALSVGSLTRADIARWQKVLIARGLHPQTRSHILQNARAYLAWLADRGELDADPYDLIRPGEIPKLPAYLPRPLPPDLDRDLQDRLAQSDSQAHGGLLLMRWTGIRVGELAGLEFDCVRVDAAGNRALKVPLGKLNTERLVPIDDETVALVRQLQKRHDSPPGRFLLERANHTKTTTAHYREALRAACIGLRSDPKPITPHRLRHTYATALMSGGIPLFALMKLLGHKDHRMTLRYAEVTLETVRREYFGALAKVESRYDLDSREPESTSRSADPTKLLSDLICWIRTQHAEQSHKATLLKRLERLIPMLEQLATRSG